MTAPPRSVFAAFTRKAIEAHDEWDSPHCFMTVHWDGESLACHTYVCVMPDIDPVDYPALMIKAAREQLEKDPDDPPYGYLLQIEGHGVKEPEPGASEEERERFNKARLGRTFHQLPDAIEVATAYCADIHGRLWVAAKRRDKPGEISENFYAPGNPKIGGQMVKGLLAVAYTTGMTAWGLPGPQGPLN